MCGRYGVRSDKQSIADAFYAKRVNPKVILAPNYNVCMVFRFVFNDGKLQRFADLRSSKAHAWSIRQRLAHMLNQFSNSGAGNLLRHERSCLTPQDRFTDTGNLDSHPNFIFADVQRAVLAKIEDPRFRIATSAMQAGIWTGSRHLVHMDFGSVNCPRCPLQGQVRTKAHDGMGV
jgi:hypothetical protein